MARSIDIWVTNNVEQISRLVETGPRIAQKYIDRPITFNGCKIDMRYVVVLKSLLPLQLYVCDEFYIRWTYDKFMMAETNFTNYDTHFTVNNYNESGAPKLRCGPFMEQFDKEYESRGIKFEELNKKVHAAIADVFIAF